MSEALLFSDVFAEATIGSEAVLQTIRNVLLCGLRSLNGRTIPPQAFGSLENVQRLYGNCHVYLNHDIPAGISRKVEELAGVVTNVRVDHLGRPRGDIRINENKAGDELRSLVKFAEKAAKAGARLKDVGMSHVARYTFSSHDHSQVQSVDEVFSCDVVIRPATTQSLMESTRTPVPERTAAEFLESLGADLQTWRDQPLDYALNERALFDPAYDRNADAGFDASEALKNLDGHSPEGSRFLESLSFS